MASRKQSSDISIIVSGGKILFLVNTKTTTRKCIATAKGLGGNQDEFFVAGVGCSVGEHQENLKLTESATYVNNGINMAEFQDMIDKTEVVYHSF